MMRAVFCGLMVLAGCFALFSGAFVYAEGKKINGVYQGKHSFVTVEVTVKDNKIDGIKIINHGGGGEKYAGMIDRLREEIIDAQSTEVDAVSGATVSSNNLKKAVDDALTKAAVSAKAKPSK